MQRSVHWVTLALTSLLWPVPFSPGAVAQSVQTPPASEQNNADTDKDQVIAPARIHNPILWSDPGNIAAKDMLLGRGGSDHQPKAPFAFVAEDMHGTNPKFDVRDGNDSKWRVKLGTESRPEVVASRLLWAVGYFTNEDYLLPTAHISGLKLKRGANLVHNDEVTDARFARKPGSEKKIALWRWKENPFEGSREFNGLRVMMAVMNNWDLKDVNNAVYSDGKRDRQIFLVSDIGATFASNDEHVHHDTDKGNLASYEHAKFIIKKTANEVSFGTPMFPSGLILRRGPVLAPEALRRSALDWIGRDIPLADARWVGGLLGQLSHQQLVDAFHAGNFPDDQVQAFVTIVETRIAELKAL